MINVKISLSDGQKYFVRNFVANNVREFEKFAFSPHGAKITFYEVLPNKLIQVSQITSVEIMTESEVEMLFQPQEIKDEGEVILPQNQPNEEIETPIDSQ